MEKILSIYSPVCANLQIRCIFFQQCDVYPTPTHRPETPAKAILIYHDTGRKQHTQTANLLLNVT